MNPDPLTQLRDYHLPDPVSWWPPAPGWWLLALLLLLALAAVLRLLRRRRRLAPRRSAQRELQALKNAHSTDGDDTALVQGLSRLLRRFALARFPRKQVAGLTGEAWLRFLGYRPVQTILVEPTTGDPARVQEALDQAGRLAERLAAGV